MTSYADAVATLYQQPLASFVIERKRLAGALKAAGDKAGAATFAKLARPPVSAWVVNQLWWQARDAFDAFLAAAAKVREGDLSAAAAHRAGLAALRVRSAALLVEHGHGATEGTLRRVALTLSAIGALGGFAPDAPGALTADRDPPGFEAMAAGVDHLRPVAAPAPGPAPPTLSLVPRPTRQEDAAAQAARVAAEREAARVAAAREAAEREQKRRERHRLETELARATAAAEEKSRELERLRLLAASAAEALAEARRALHAIEAALARL